MLRLPASAKRVSRAGTDGGFTLIELMVVLMILAILLAVIIPSYLGARERSQDRAAQVNLRHALTAAKVVYSDYGSYGPLAPDAAALPIPEGCNIDDLFDTENPISPTNTVPEACRRITTATPAVIAAIYAGQHRAEAAEPVVTWTLDDSDGPEVISYDARMQHDERRYNVLALSALSQTDVCWVIYDDDEQGTFYGHIDLDGLPEVRLRETCKALKVVQPNFLGPPFGKAAPNYGDFLLHRVEPQNDNPFVLIPGPVAPPPFYTPEPGDIVRPLCMYTDGWRPIYRAGGGDGRYACPPIDPLPRS